MGSALQRVISNILTTVGKTNLATGYTLEGGTTSKTLTVDTDKAITDLLNKTGSNLAIGAYPSMSQYIADNYCIQLYLNTNDVQRAVVKSFDADGFTLTWNKASNPSGTATIYYAAIR